MPLPTLPLVTTIPVGYTPHNQLHIDENNAINYLVSDTQSANLFLASPDGLTGAGSFRAIANADLTAALFPSYTDPVAAMTGATIGETITQTAAMSVAGFGLVAQLTKATGGFNSTSATGMSAFRANINITGSGGTETLAVAMQASPTVSGGVVVTTLRGFSLGTPSISGGSVVTNSVAIRLAVQNVATNNTYLLIGQSAQAAGNWGIYNVSTFDNAIAGNVRIGSTVAPTTALDVTGTATVDVLRIDQTPIAATPVPTHTFTINLNGTVYRIPCVI